MKALSLTQPWPWIILHLGKRIENRSRNLGNYRGTLLLHASKGMTRTAYENAYCFVSERFGPEVARRVPTFASPLLARGAVVGVCEVVDQIAPEDAHGYARAHASFSEFDQPGELFPPGQEPWYMGAHAYVLDQVRELTAPIPCKGALGLWTPPTEVVSQVRTWMSGGERP